MSKSESELDDYRQRLQLKLAPEAMNLALIRAGAFLTGYEFVKRSILTDLEEFYTVGLQPGREHPRYVAEVLALGANPFQASVAWLVKNEVLTSRQAVDLEVVRAHRNEIAHELAKLLVDVDADLNVSLLLKLHGIMRSLDRFWISISVDTNPDFDGKDVDLDSARSGSGLLFNYLLQLCGVDPSP